MVWQLIFISKTVTNFSIPLHLLLIHQALPLFAVSSCCGCSSCCTYRNIAIKCDNQDHLRALPRRWWPPLTCSTTFVPNSNFLSAWSTNAFRQHLNFPLIYAFFLVFLALSKPLHLYRSFHFFLNSLVLCTFSAGISHSYPTKPL